MLNAEIFCQQRCCYWWCVENMLVEQLFMAASSFQRVLCRGSWPVWLYLNKELGTYVLTNIESGGVFMVKTVRRNEYKMFKVQF